MKGCCVFELLSNEKCTKIIPPHFAYATIARICPMPIPIGSIGNNVIYILYPISSTYFFKMGGMGQFMESSGEYPICAFAAPCPNENVWEYVLVHYP